MPQKTKNLEMGASKLFKLLKADHEKVAELFEEVEENGTDEVIAKDLFMEIQKELQIHMQGEEKFLYPILEQHEEHKEMVLEALEEHD